MTRRYFTNPYIRYDDILLVFDPGEEWRQRFPTLPLVAARPKLLGVHFSRYNESSFGTCILSQEFLREEGPNPNPIRGSWVEITEEAAFRRCPLPESISPLRTTHKLGAPKGKLP